MSLLKTLDNYFLPVILISSIGIVANLMLLFAFIKDPLKCFRNSATYLVGNLAFSDFLYNVANIAPINQTSEHQVIKLLKYFSFYLSMLTIASIALDRYLMIAYPFKHRIFMSGNKMAVWIAFVWLLSSIHPIVKITISDGSDHLIKAGVGLGLIILTGILYGKIYFKLRKQAKAMFGKKARYSSRQIEYSSDNRILKDGEICICNPGCIEKQNSYTKTESICEQDGCILTQDDRAQNQYEGARAQNQNERVQNQNERGLNHDERAQNHDQRAQYQNERAQNHDEHALNQNEHAQNQNKRAQNHDARAQNQNQRAQNHHEHAQNQNERALNHDERAQNQNERAQNHDEHALNQNEYAQNQNERAQNHDARAQNQNQRAQNHDEHAQNQNERAQNHDERAQNQNERAQNHDERAQHHDERAQTLIECVQYENQKKRVQYQNQNGHTENQNDIDNSTMDVSHISSMPERISSQSLSSKSLKNSQAINNAKEQKFLNTIIIIVCIAVITVAPGTIYSQFWATAVAELNPETNRILAAVIFSTVSLNFAVNPFVYVLRLKRYRKTFKMVYGCD